MLRTQLNTCSKRVLGGQSAARSFSCIARGTPRTALVAKRRELGITSYNNLASHSRNYAAAAEEMDALAARQPGYHGIESTRDAAGFGITISFWANEASALAWRAHPRHAEIRELGRGRWYDWYEVIVAEASRGYRWAK